MPHRSTLRRWLYLHQLQDRNETLFYRLLQDHFEEIVSSSLTNPNPVVLARNARNTSRPLPFCPQPRWPPSHSDLPPAACCAGANHLHPHGRLGLPELRAAVQAAPGHVLHRTGSGSDEQPRVELAQRPGGCDRRHRSEEIHWQGPETARNPRDDAKAAAVTTWFPTPLPPAPLFFHSQTDRGSWGSATSG